MNQDYIIKQLATWFELVLLKNLEKAYSRRTGRRVTDEMRVKMLPLRRSFSERFNVSLIFPCPTLAPNCPNCILLRIAKHSTVPQPGPTRLRPNSAALIILINRVVQISPRKVVMKLVLA